MAINSYNTLPNQLSKKKKKDKKENLQNLDESWRQTNGNL